MADTVFGKIVSGEIPTDFVYEDEHCVVIKDLHPQAPTHLLVIPRKAIPKLSDASEEDQALLGHLMLVVGKLTRAMGVSDGFRVVVNNGEGGGQTVFHLHLHILAGRDFDEATLARGINA